MIIIREGRSDFPTPSDLREIAKYDRLADDLKFALSYPLQPFGDSHSLPILQEWSMSTRQAPCLIGTAYGHPNFGVREFPFTTSELVLFAPDLGLARTRSRWFRLGARLEAGEA